MQHLHIPLIVIADWTIAILLSSPFCFRLAICCCVQLSWELIPLTRSNKGANEMTPLRKQMLEDMVLRGLSKATQQAYVHAVGRTCEILPTEQDI